MSMVTILKATLCLIATSDIICNATYVSHGLTGSLVGLNGISFPECKQECNARRKCERVRYLRRFGLCQLLGSSYVLDNQTHPGEYIYTKDSYLHNTTEFASACGLCAPHQDCFINTTSSVVSCITDRCDDPASKPFTSLYGNSYKVGSKIKYVCNPPNNDYDIVTCENNGSWSTASLTCNCDFPLIDNAASASMVTVNESFVEVKYECLPGYESRDFASTTCNINTGKVSNNPNFFSCCDVETRNGWTKVFRQPASLHGNAFLLWRDTWRLTTGIGMYCKFRKSAIVDNWENFHIQKVKVDVVKDERIVAYVIFNGIGSTYLDWFDGSRLLESSWDDLTPSTAPSVGIFSLVGINRNGNWSSCFVIAQDSLDKCSNDVGWLNIAKHNNSFNCPSVLEGKLPLIVYALEHKSGIFSADDPGIGFADRIEIWTLN